VRAAGNANDHRRVTRERPLADAIVAGDVRRIDLLRLTVGSGPNAQTRFAHSYIGVGLTPVVAVDLEKGGKGSWKEIVSVVRVFSRFRPFPIRLEDGRRRTIDSLLFANIDEMAKYATLSEDSRPDDGRFEVITQRRTGKLRVLATAIRAATQGLGPQPSATHYAFTTLAPMPLQLDGELMELDADTPVAVDIAPRALATIF
jgi:diacylglycerol kinase family enzyme